MVAVLLRWTAALPISLRPFLLDPRRLPPLAAALLFAALFLAIPTAGFEPVWSTALYAGAAAGGQDGQLLGAAVAMDGQWRFPPAAQAPERFALALEAFEDRRFRGHVGFDPRAIARALVGNAEAGRIVSGGSTLPMQIARLSRAAARPGAPPRRALGSKLVELALALRLEFAQGKDELLELYAAHAPFGGNVVGLEAASFRWFGRPPTMLTWAEAATLAVLPNAPGLAHLSGDREALKTKRDRLLSYLQTTGHLSGEDLGLARAEPLPDKPEPLPALAPHLVEAARRRGLDRVETQIDASLQIRLLALSQARALRNGAEGIGNLACIILRISDGATLAYVGNAASIEAAALSGEVDCAAAARSSGSILKPFLYAAMLDSGELAPGTLVADIPTRVGSFSPENYSRGFDGAVRADEALARSLNVPFVRLLRSYGVDRLHALLRSLGFAGLFRRAEDYGLSLIIGGAEVTLIETAAAFADLAKAARGEAEPGYPLSAGAAALTLRALADAERPSEEVAWREFANARRIAWKTGTSQGWRDAWAIGTDGEHVVAVWAGNATGEGRFGLSGAVAAAPLLFEAFGLLPRSSGLSSPAEAFRYETVCGDSGYLAGPDCLTIQRVQLPRSAQTGEVCPYCRLVHLSADGAFRTSAECAAGAGHKVEKRFVLPPAMEWWYRRKRLDYRPLPPPLPGCESFEAGSPMALVVPEASAALLVPVELDGSPGAIVMSAVHRDLAARLYWHLDGDFLGQTSGEHRMVAGPAPGFHTLVLVDQAGERLERRFQVLDANE